ncbi:RHS repeat-associated core domain-containing protein [Comamonas sp. JUb58]|uniref:RHS repeat-associated core domain-containing protein n=1 Tax=Comamonas sp. JUb58 TaxID=2485114 RepID=UPI001414E500
MQLDAWGNVRAEHNPGDLYQPIRLPGQHADEVTGLYYNRHRYYESEIGDYINQDPIGLVGGLNKKSYVGSSPLTYHDPVGLIRWADVGSNTVGAVGSGAGVFLGAALFAFPSGVSQVVGAAMFSKSIYGFGASMYGLARAFSDDASYDMPSKYQTLPRVVATSISCSPNAERYADAAELALDLAAGRLPAGFKNNPSGYLRNSVGYPQIDSSNFTSPATYSAISSQELNALSNLLQLTQGGLKSEAQHRCLIETV